MTMQAKLIAWDDTGEGCRHCRQDVTCRIRYCCPTCRRTHEARVCSSVGPAAEGMCDAGILDFGTDHGEGFRAELVAVAHDLLDASMSEASGVAVEEIRRDRIDDFIGPVQGHA